MPKLRWLICVFILVTSALAQDAGGKLKMAVIVTRHGVRPSLSKDTTSPYARDPWPTLEQWGARCPGDLTQTGIRLAALMGAYYHAYYAQQGLLTDDCPSQQVYIWADNEERTEGTAHALATGLERGLHGCSVKVNSLHYTPPDDKCDKNPDDPTDYYFHPLADKKLPKLDHDKMQAIVDAINNSLPALNAQYAPELATLQKVLICCDASQCPTPPCTLPTLPEQATLDSDNKLKWQGLFGQGSTATENLLLEYANGMPCSIVGWKRVAYDYTQPDCKPPGGQPFRRMQRIHTLYFEKNQQSFYIAQTQGSNLANQIFNQLQAGVTPGPVQPLVIYAGHDTNLANLAGLLDLSWTFSDLPANDTPPAGALVFELYQDRKREFSVRIRFVHAKMAQMRTKSVLSLSNPPEWSEVSIHNCSNPCPFSSFQAIMSKVIDKNYLAPNPPEH